MKNLLKSLTGTKLVATVLCMLTGFAALIILTVSDDRNQLPPYMTTENGTDILNSQISTVVISALMLALCFLLPKMFSSKISDIVSVVLAVGLLISAVLLISFSLQSQQMALETSPKGEAVKAMIYTSGSTGILTSVLGLLMSAYGLKMN